MATNAQRLKDPLRVFYKDKSLCNFVLLCPCGKILYPMQTPFLKSLAETILSKYPASGNRLCVVMPNRRAGLFLKNYLAPDDDIPIWAPDIYSIEDFVEEVSGYAAPDSLEQLSALYKAHCAIKGEEALSFDDFIGWSKGLVRDFEETDQYLADPRALFGHLSETRALSLWNLDGRPLTEFELNYLAFYRSLHDYYHQYREILLAKGLSYHGQTCRMLAENPEKYLACPQWDHLIFAGFNAITPAQVKIFHHLVLTGKAKMLWDADAYYINNPHQEAGHFLRKLVKDQKLGETPELSDHFATFPRNIHIAGVPRQVGQTMLAGSIISKIMEESGPEVLGKTAVVLADESLLIPLLNAIPPETGAFNVTMGFPLAQSPLFSLMDGILEMHINASDSGNGEVSFYHKNLLQVLQHSHMQHLVAHTAIQEVLRTIRNMKRSFIGPGDLDKVRSDNPFLEIALQLMQKTDTAGTLIHLLQDFVEKLKPVLAAKTNTNELQVSPESEMLYNIAVILKRLETLSAEAGLIESPQTLRNLFREAAQTMPVAFYGEPLKGIQVMGMLETRTLDFENIIMLSVNEDKLPSGRSFNSFIPIDIRREFSLPTHHDQQAVYAYHFYRLLQRGKNIWLLYDSEADGLGGGEKSRFISQIVQELNAYSPRNTLTEISPLMNSSLVPPNPLIIQKDKTVMSRLLQMAENGLSPSRVSQYLNCPMRFYLSSILRLGETDEVEETIDFRTLGIAVHEVMQQFYEPFKGSFPPEPVYKEAIQTIEAKIAGAMERNYPGGETGQGRNLLIVKVAETWLKRYLTMESEAGYRPENGDHIIALEKELKHVLRINFEGEMLEIKLKGIADRIDCLNGITRVIDYKTGKVEAAELNRNPEAVFNNDKEAVHEKAFQLYFYLLMSLHTSEINTNTDNLSAGIITFRKLNEGYLSLNFQNMNMEEAIVEFEDRLKGLLEEMYDSSLPFKRTDFKKRCENCLFKVICDRDDKKGDW